MTPAAAGHLTIRADVEQVALEPFKRRGVTGIWASPPCPDFSAAGKGAGRTGETGRLIEEVPRWVGALRPEWVACEQVPPALEVWEEFAHQFRAWGYSAWTGILCAADYGVGQTRYRAILMASRVRAVAPPAATHAEDPHPVLFGPQLEPWLTMAEALGWHGVLDPGQNYPLVGNKTQRFAQVGNLVPPPLAEAIVRAVTGMALEAAA